MTGKFQVQKIHLSLAERCGGEGALVSYLSSLQQAFLVGYSGLMPAFLMTRAHSDISSAMTVLKRSGVLPAASMP